MPKARILGTHNPTKMAWSEFPVKNKTSEYTNDSIAEIKSNLSVTVNFFNMIIFLATLMTF